MYTRMKELLEQVLLEFDPKHEKDPNFFDDKISGQHSASTIAHNKEWDRQERVSTRPKRKLKKVTNRALARGGAGDKSNVLPRRKKLSGPKGKLPK